MVNASGGPLLDIVVPVDGEPTGAGIATFQPLYSPRQPGFHATDAASYAHALAEALNLPREAELAMRRRARTHAVQKFSAQEFTKGWAASGWQDWRRAVRAERERARLAVAQKAADEKKTQ